MENINKDKKHNAKCTKTAQKENQAIGKKRRVNISIDGSVWDDIEKLDYTNKSKFIEDLLKQQLEKYYKNK